MTMTVDQAAKMPLLQRLRASRLPPPAERRAIREAAKLSREDIARELRAKGHRVTAAAVFWWEKDKADGGFDPRPPKAVTYRQLLDELHALVEEAKSERVQK